MTSSGEAERQRRLRLGLVEAEWLYSGAPCMVTPKKPSPDDLARNAAQCPYLLVQLQPDLPARRLTLIASFSFSSEREWQQVETHISLAGLQAEIGPEPRFVEAFARLDDGIGAARIARLFSPLSLEQRIAAGR